MELKPCPFCGAILKWCEDSCSYIHTSDAECFLVGIGVLEEMFVLWNARDTDSLLKEMTEDFEVSEIMPEDRITESVVLTNDQLKEAILDFIYKNERNITYPIEATFDKDPDQIEIKYKCFRKGD